MALTRAPSARWVRSPSVLWRRSLGVTYVLGTGDVIALGGPAAVLWEVLGESTTSDDAIAALALLHGEPTAAVEHEIGEMIERLAAQGLLRDTATTTAPPALAVAHRAPGTTTTPAMDPSAAIAGWDLPGCPLRLPDPAVAGWPALVESIRRERLSGLAVAAHLAGDLPLSDDEIEPLRTAHRDAMVTCLRLERLLISTVDALEDVGIEPLVIKGPSIAHLRYEDPSMRPFGDIDLLVPAAQLDRAFAVLSALGHERRYPQPRPGFDQRFGKGAAFVADDGLEIDVHRTFASGPFGLTVDTEDAHRNARTFTVGGRTLRTLADSTALVSLAMHAVLGTRLPRLLNLRDVAQVADQVDVDEAIAVSTRWRVDAAVALAVRHAADRFELESTPLVTWARAHTASGAQERALRVYTSADRSYARQALAALPALPGTRARAAYVRAMVFPDRSYVAGRDGSQRRRWLRIARVLSRSER